MGHFHGAAQYVALTPHEKWILQRFSSLPLAVACLVPLGFEEVAVVVVVVVADFDDVVAAFD